MLAALRCKRLPAAALVRQQNRQQQHGQGQGQRRCLAAATAMSMTPRAGSHAAPSRRPSLLREPKSARRQGDIGSLRKELYNLQNKPRQQGAKRKVIDVAKALPAAAASADCVRELADVCRLLAKAQEPQRRNTGRAWKDAALGRSLDLLRAPTEVLEPRTLASLAHTLTLLQVQFTDRDNELVDLLGQHIASSAEDALSHRDSTAVSERWDQRSVAMAMQALAKLSVRHDPALCALAGLVPQLEPSLTPRCTTSILWALATLNCTEEPYRMAADQLSRRLTANVSDGEGGWTEARTVVTAVWSLTVLDKLSAPAVRALFAVLTAAEKRGEFKASQGNIPLLCQLHQIFLAVELGHLVEPQQKQLGAPAAARRPRAGPPAMARPPRLGTRSSRARARRSTRARQRSKAHHQQVQSAVVIPDRWVERCRKAWRGTTRAVSQSSPHSSPAAEVERALALARPEAQVKSEQLLPDCGYSIDVLLPDQKVVVEHDGKVHYCRHGPWEVQTDRLGAGQRKLGRTALKQRQIESFGWRMVSVAWWEWEALRTEGKGAEVRWLARETRGGQGVGGDAEKRSSSEAR